MRTTVFPRASGTGVQAGVISTLPATRESVPPAPRPLSKSESADLAKCEAQIQDCLDRISKDWRQVARLLRHIQEEKLYRAEFKRFEDYTRARFAKSAHRARQLISGEGVMEDLEEGQPAAAPGMLPTTESQVRPLVPLPKEERREAWDEAKAIAGPGKLPTAKHVAEAIQKRRPAPAIGKEEEDEKAPVVIVAMSRVKLGGNGDICNAYSACELMGKEPCEIRKPFEHEGTLWCTGGGMHDSDGRSQYDANPLILRSDYRGPERRQYSYEGYLVTWKFKLYRLGPRTIFRGDKRLDLAASEDPPVQVRGHERSPATSDGNQRALACGKVRGLLAQLPEIVRIFGGFTTSEEKGWYHLDKAKDHLRCLEGLLSRASVAPPDASATKGKVDPNSVFVIARRPVRGAVAGSAAQWRYAGNPGGWTPDPNKVTPYTSRLVAQEKAERHSDQVESLAQALRRWK